MVTIGYSYSSLFASISNVIYWQLLTRAEAPHIFLLPESKIDIGENQSRVRQDLRAKSLKTDPPCRWEPGMYVPNPRQSTKVP